MDICAGGIYKGRMDSHHIVSAHPGVGMRFDFVLLHQKGAVHLPRLPRGVYAPENGNALCKAYFANPKSHLPPLRAQGVLH